MHILLSIIYVFNNLEAFYHEHQANFMNACCLIPDSVLLFLLSSPLLWHHFSVLGDVCRISEFKIIDELINRMFDVLL